MNFPSNGQLLKKLRKELKISQSELAMGRINVNTISRLENDKMKLTPVIALVLSDNINKLAKEKRKDIRVTTVDLLISDARKCECWCLHEMETAPNIPEAEAKIKKYMEILDSAYQYGLSNVVEKVYTALGRLFFEENNIEKAIEYYSLSLERFEKSCNAYKAADTLNSLGKCYYSSDIKRAKELYHKACSIIKEAEPDERKAELNSKLLYNKALCCILEKDFEGTKVSMQELKDAGIGDEDIRIRLQLLKGISEMLHKQYEQSADTFTEILRYQEGGIKKYKYILFNNLAINLCYLGRTEEALAYFEKAVKEQLAVDFQDITLSLLNSSYGYFDSNNYDIALRYAEGALHSAVKHRQHGQVIECYYILYKIYMEKKLLERCSGVLEECADYIKKNSLGEGYTLLNQFMCLQLMLLNNEYQKAKYLVEGIVNGKPGTKDQDNKSVHKYNIIYPQPAVSINQDIFDRGCEQGSRA